MTVLRNDIIMNLYDRDHLQLIYIGYPFGGNLENLDKAEEIVASLSALFDAVFWAPWVPLCRKWKNSGVTLERGHALDVHAIKLSSQVWLCYDPLSPGMKIEEQAAKKYGVPVRYLSEWIFNDIITAPHTALVKAIKFELANDIVRKVQ